TANEAAIPLATIAANVTLAKSTFNAGGKWFDGLVADISGEVTAPHASGIAVDRVGFRARANGDKATLDPLEIVQTGNTVSLTGSGTIPAESAKWMLGPVDLKIQISAPDLGQL